MAVATGSRPGQPVRSRRPLLNEYTVTAALFLLPTLIAISLFIIWPIIDSFRLSLFKWNGVDPVKLWIGAENWSRLLQDGVFWRAVRNNFVIVLLSILVQVPVGMVLAVLLDSGVRSGADVFKAIALGASAVLLIVSALDDAELVEAMVGRSVKPIPAERPAAPTDRPPVLELRRVSTEGPPQSCPKGGEHTVGPGEDPAVAGAVTNGGAVGFGGGAGDDVGDPEKGVAAIGGRIGAAEDLRAAHVVEIDADPVPLGPGDSVGRIPRAATPP